MTKHTYFYIDESWPDSPLHFRWVQHTSTTNQLEFGSGGSAEIPPSDAYSVILTGSQVNCLQVPMPKTSQKDQSQLLNFALEPFLLDAPINHHVVVTDKHERWTCRVIDKKRLQFIVKQFLTLNIRLQGVYSIQDCVHEGQVDAMNFALFEDIFYYADTHQFFALDESIIDETLLKDIVPITSTDESPKNLHLAVVYQDEQSHRLQQLLECYGSVTIKERSFLPSTHAHNLLQGAFKPKQSWQERASGLLWSASITLALLLTYQIVDLAILIKQQLALNDIMYQQQQLFKTVLPNTPVQSMRSQFAQAINQQRQIKGLLPDNSGLVLLASVLEQTSPSMQQQVTTISYSKKELTISFNPGLDNDLRIIASHLSLQQMVVSVNDNQLVIQRRQP